MDNRCQPAKRRKIIQVSVSMTYLEKSDTLSVMYPGRKDNPILGKREGSEADLGPGQPARQMTEDITCKAGGKRVSECKI